MNNDYYKKIIYNSGDVFLPESLKHILGIDIIGSSKNTFYISGWSIVHFINGIIVGFLYLYFKYDIHSYTLKLLTLHTFWELWQVLIGMAKPYKLTGRSNLIDSIMDTVLFMLGAYLIRFLMLEVL
uniref:VanZ-like domain-containing protein n=1 Tax=viral metagenome TaxID=1070528 RepID=A0A6C0IJP5_9ZZZZ